MKRFLLTLFIFALSAALAAFALAPVALRQYRLWENGKAVSQYREAAERLSLVECGAMLAQAQDYNEALNSAGQTDDGAPLPAGTPEAGEKYTSLIDPSGNGVMAVLSLPKLGVSLAVYHGGEDGGEAARVTHDPQSRLPSGKSGGPCVLRAARERFFDPFAGLNRLIIGDCFFLRVLRETWTYEVYQVAAASPQEPVGPAGEGNDDECVLVTEISGAGGKQRLMVRGRRVSRMNVSPADDTRALPDWVSGLVFAAPAAAAGLILLMVTEALRRPLKRHMRRRMRL